MTSRALEAGFPLTVCEAKLLLASTFVIVSGSAAGRFTQNGSVSAVTLESYGIVIALCPSGKIPSEEKKSWK
jgi:hypothetical protein